MKFRLTILAFLLCFKMFGQISTSYPPTISKTIISRLAEKDSVFDSLITQIVKNGEGKINVTGYRICDSKVFTVDSLDKTLDSMEILDLLKSQNGTIKFVGFILFARRNNDKQKLVDKLEEFLLDKYITIRSDKDCNHAIKVSDFADFAFDLISRNTPLFSPKFKFTKKERKYWEKRLTYRNSTLM